MRRTLQQLRPVIVFEYNAESGPEACERLVKLGYRLHDIEHRPVTPPAPGLLDVLAIPPR